MPVMNGPLRTAAVAFAVLFLCAAGSAQAGVTVAYDNPANFTDAKLYYGFGKKPDKYVLRDLGRHLDKLGARYLPAGQDLKIEVLDIDLAGNFRPVGRAGENLRILDQGTWPRIKLRYTLEQDGAVLAQGEDYLIDQNYLTYAYVGSTSDSLRYEKRLLTDWFRKRFEQKGS
jgi:hypothetical protein